MADLSDFELINISGLPSGTAAGSNLLAQDDGSNTTKITINQAVAASQAMQQVNNKIGDTALPTTAQTLTGAIAEMNKKFTSYLPADTNIDNWITTGFWVYQREAPYSHTGTYPVSDQYGTLICVNGTSSNFAMQMIRSNSTSRTEGTLYIRYRSAGTWGSWFTYEDNHKFVIETKTVSIPDIQGGGTGWVSASVAKSGYNAIGVVGWYCTDGTANTWLFPYSMKVRSNTTSVALRNFSTSATASGVSLQLDVLYQKA